MAVPYGETGTCKRFNQRCEKAKDLLITAGIPATRIRAAAAHTDDAVNVGTVHTFKRLKYRRAAVVGVNTRALPNPWATTVEELDRLQHEADLTAERCLPFVARTPARGGLYVSWPASRAPSWQRPTAGQGSQHVRSPSLKRANASTRKRIDDAFTSMGRCSPLRLVTTPRQRTS